MGRFEGQRVFVLGGAGFVGSHLCERLLDEGATVVAVDNFLTGSQRNVTHLLAHPQFTLREHDITVPFTDAGPVHAVLNFASPASPIDYATLWLETMRVGAVGTQHGLELAEKHDAVFLQASTSEVYGDPLVHPQVESYRGNVDPTGPRAVYDEAKRYAEALVQAFRRARGVKTRIVRIFNTYGPRMRANDGRIVPALIGQALRGEAFTIFGDGTQTRSFCFVDDLVEGVLRLVLSNESDPINIGNPDERTILEFAACVRALTGVKNEITFRPLPQGDPTQRRPDITRAKSLLHWEPRVSLETGLATTIEWFRTTL